MILSKESKYLLNVFLKHSYGTSYLLDMKRLSKFVQQTLDDNSLFMVEYNETYDYIKENGNFSDKDTDRIINLYYR